MTRKRKCKGKNRCQRRNHTLDGATRTCVEYACVPGHGFCAPGKKGCRKSPGKPACKKGYVLRCVHYVNEAALPPFVGQRKTWPQYIHAATSTSRTLRAMYPPAVSPSKPLRPVTDYRRNVARRAKAKRK